MMSEKSPNLDGFGEEMKIKQRSMLRPRAEKGKRREGMSCYWQLEICLFLFMDSHSFIRPASFNARHGRRIGIGSNVPHDDEGIDFRLISHVASSPLLFFFACTQVRKEASQPPGKIASWWAGGVARECFVGEMAGLMETPAQIPALPHWKPRLYPWRFSPLGVRQVQPGHGLGIELGGGQFSTVYITLVAL